MDINELRAANRGEWSELYVLFKIFKDKAIPAADSELMPVTGKSYKFLKVFREEALGIEKEYNLENDNSVIILDSDGNILKTLDTSNLGTKTKKMFAAIKGASGASFQMDELSELMSEYLIHKVKANSSEKTDLLALLDDQTNITNEKMGFSIKSHVGGAPTLINSSSQTNFLYEITGFNGYISDINSIEGRSKMRDRLQAIYADGGRLSFVSISSPTFTTNLRYTDTIFPNLLAYMLLDFYSGKGNSLGLLARLVAERSELNISEQEIIYKTKGFLRASALGMVPSIIWNTRLSTYGGYIVVLNNGSLVCYSLLKDDDFKDYLFNNTKFDTPSTTRHGYGFIFEDNGKLFINLNLQIRFNK